MPEGIASVAAEEKLFDFVTLTAEPGIIGGIPQGGLDFGAAINTDAIIHQNQQFDFYDGGGLDIAFLGLAEADLQGNVNVSRFGTKIAGTGGFINISQNARKLVYAGTFAAGDTDISVADGRLKIDRDGKCKFREMVSQITFSGKVAAASGQPVLYVTERCVFRSTAEGLEMVEVAPGADIERDIIARMPFRPLMGKIKQMDARLFTEETIGLRERMLELPLGERISYDPDRNTLFLNFEGLYLRDLSQLEALRDTVTAKCKTIGKRMAATLKALRAKLRQRMHTSPRETGKWLAQVVRGYFQYHAIPGNWDRLKAYRNDVLRMWFQTLRRRSQRSRLSWDRFREGLGSLLPPVEILQPYPAERFDAKYPQILGKNRVR